ncbi:MAG: nucleotide pyrophosphatase [Nonomuraea sp.]|nr:nucleotide pyrophosphatase [Nonomuraea sp.]
MIRRHPLIALMAAAALIPALTAAADPDPNPDKQLGPSSLQAATVPSGISTDKVLVVGMDGLRNDRIAAANAPTLKSLMATGTYGTSLLYAKPMSETSSGPGWSTIATGVWPDKHGVVDNTFTGKHYDTYPDFLTRLESANPGFSTYAAVDWTPLIDEGTFGSAVDTRLKISDPAGWPASDEAVTTTSIPVLRDQNPDAAFVYLGNIDIVGHSKGAASKDYLDAIAASDAQLGRLIAAVKARPTYAAERWTVIVATDHGHTDAGGHGGSSIEERRTFVLASGPGIAAGAKPADTRLTDVAATVLSRLKVAIPAALDGVPVNVRSGDPFEGVSLAQRTDETGIPAGVLGYSHTPPPGWSVDNAAMPSGGVTEWRGWSFTTDEFWSRAQRDQSRELNVRSRGTFAVADSDEWDDKSHGSGPFDSTLVSPSYGVSGRSSVKLGYTTYYRQDGTQRGQVLVSFDGGTPSAVRTYSADVPSRRESITVAVPAGATSMRVRFRCYDADNAWYWVVDDVTVG